MLKIPPTRIAIGNSYKELGTYAAVGRKIGRSGSTVAKYVQMKGFPQNVRLAVGNLAQKNM